MTNTTTDLAVVAQEIIQKLPDIMEIYSLAELPVLRENMVFETLVNQEPKKDWLSVHPTITLLNPKTGKYTEPYYYLPIERVEWLLVNIVRRYKTKVKDVKQIANSVVVTVKLKYWHPVFNEWVSHEGVGAAPLQTEKGKGAIAWDYIKSNAVQIGAPAAKSFAIKDAAEHIGRLFGRDLNRKELIPFDKMLDRVDKYEKLITSQNPSETQPEAAQ